MAPRKKPLLNCCRITPDPTVNGIYNRDLFGKTSLTLRLADRIFADKLAIGLR